MRFLIALSFVLFTNSLSYGQDPKEILLKAIHKCEDIEQGYYQMTETTKTSMGPDSTKRRLGIYFKKLPADKIFGFAFAVGWPGSSTDLNIAVYTGKEMVYVYPNNRTAKILATDKWAGNIEDSKNSFNFYSPLSAADHKPLPTLQQLETPYFTYDPVVITKLKKKPCYLVKVHINPDSINTEGMKFTKSDLRFWISEKDSLVLQYDMDYNMIMSGQEKLDQYQKLSLDTFSLNQAGTLKALTMDGIPSDVKMEEYIIENGPELLKKDDVAPSWKLASLTEDSLSLSDLKGNLVLLDFFFKSSYPAMKILPELQSLSENYASKGLRVIGINPYDLKNEELKAIPAKLGLTFPILTYGKKVAGEYHIGSYPTLYLIDRNGKVISTFVGYSSSLKSQLEKAIQGNL